MPRGLELSARGCDRIVLASCTFERGDAARGRSLERSVPVHLCPPPRLHARDRELLSYRPFRRCCCAYEICSFPSQNVGLGGPQRPTARCRADNPLLNTALCASLSSWCAIRVPSDL